MVSRIPSTPYFVSSRSSSALYSNTVSAGSFDMAKRSPMNNAALATARTKALIPCMIFGPESLDDIIRSPYVDKHLSSSRSLECSSLLTLTSSDITASIWSEFTSHSGSSRLALRSYSFIRRNSFARSTAVASPLPPAGRSPDWKCNAVRRGVKRWRALSRQLAAAPGSVDLFAWYLPTPIDRWPALVGEPT